MRLTSVKKMLRAAAVILGALLCLCLLAGAGLLFWLRSPQGEAHVASLLVRALAEQGYSLDLKGLSGPLPERALLRGLTIGDKDGPLARARELEIRLGLGDLLAKRLTIDLARLTDAELIRLPQAAPVAALGGGVAPSPPELPDLTLPLPLTLTLKKLSLEKIHVRTSALVVDPLPEELPALGPLPGLLTLNGTAFAGLDKGLLRAGADMTLITDAGQQLNLKADTGLRREGGFFTANGSLVTPLVKSSSSLSDGEPGRSEKRTQTAKLDYDLAAGLVGPLPVISARAEMRGSDLTWPAPELEGLLGADLTLRTGLSGGVDTPWTLVLEEARAGSCVLSGRAAYAPAGPDPLRHAVDAELKAEIADLAPLHPDLAGPLHAGLTVGGRLGEPDLKAVLFSPNLHIRGEEFREPAVRLGAACRFDSAGEFAAEGELALSVDNSPAGPGSLEAAWKAALPQGGAPLSLFMRGLKGQLAGVGLSGDCSAVLPGRAGALLHLEGGLKAQSADLSRLAALFGVSLQAGPAEAELRLARADGGQSAILSLTAGSLALPEGTPALRRIALEARAERLWTEPLLRLNLSTGEGQAGPLRWNSGRASLEGGFAGGFSLALESGAEKSAASGTRPRSRGKANAAKPAGPKKNGLAAAAPMAVSAPGAPGVPVSLALNGSYDLKRKTATLSGLSFSAPDKKIGARLLAPLSLDYTQGLRLHGLKAELRPGGSLIGDADLRPGLTRLNARLTALPFAVLALAAGADLPEGSLDAELAYAVGSGAPKGSLRLRARTGDGKKKAAFPPLSLRLDAGLEQAGGLLLRGAGSLGLPDSEGTLRFALPLSARDGGPPLPDAARPMSASFVWNTALAPLWRFVPLPGRSLSGQLAVNLGLSGSPGAPRLAGTAYLAGGRYEDKVLGLLLTDMALEAHANPGGAGEALRLVAAAEDGAGGSLALEGALTLANAPALALRGQVRHLKPLHRDDLSLTLSGLFSLSGPLAAPALKADLIVEQGELNLLTVLSGSSVRTLDISEAGQDMRQSGAGPTCALHIDVPRRFFIRGRGLDSEWQGGLDVVGPLSRPALSGSLRPVRGAFDLLSKSFAFTGGEITFAGGGRINPGINLELTYEGPDITAVANVSGSAQKPGLELSSRPPLARDEVLAHVLFGKSVSQLSRFEALQLANGLRELSGAGGSGLDVLAGMRKTLGLDVLRVGDQQTGKRSLTGSGMSGAGDAPGAAQAARNRQADSSDTTPSLEAGKYINDSIYVGVEQGATQESTGVRVEIELAPRVSLQGKTTPNSSQVGIGWKKDY